MAKIRFENGTVVNFDGKPTQKDVEEVAQKLGIGQKKTQQSPARQVAKPTDTDQAERTFLEPTGGIPKFLQGLFKPAATVAVRPAQAIGTGVASLFGREASVEDQTLDLPFFGKIAPPTSGKDVVRDIGRVAETAALGIGAGPAASVAKQTLKGAGFQALKRGAIGGSKVGAVSGAGQQLEKDGEFSGDTVLSALFGGGTGAILGGATGGAFGAVGAGTKRGLQSAARRTDKVAPLSKLRETTLLDDAIKITKPVLGKKDRIAAIKSGRGVEKGFPFFKSVDVKSGKRDVQIANAVKNVVKKGQGEVRNIRNINREVSRIDAGIKGGLKQNNAIFNTQQLRNRLSQAKEKSRVIFGTDKNLEKQYDAIIDEMVSNVDKKNLSGLFEARQAFDKVIRQKFPRTFSGDVTDNVRRNAILDVRREVNEFIADNLPKGSPFKALLKQEHLMLEGAENIAEQAAQKIPKELRQRINVILAIAAAGAVSAFGSFIGTAPLRSFND